MKEALSSSEIPLCDVQLSYHPKIETIEQALAISFFDEMKMAEKLRRTKLYENRILDNEHFNIGNFHGALGEIYFNSVLEDLISEDDSNIVLDPIMSGSETENYTFHFEPEMKSLISVNKSTGQEVAEYDRVILIEDQGEEFPVIFEVKFENGMINDHRNSLFQRSQPEKLEKAIRPISEYFDTDKLGFVAVVPKERVYGGLSFVRAGGNIITFPFTYDEFLLKCLSTKVNGKF